MPPSQSMGPPASTGQTGSPAGSSFNQGFTAGTPRGATQALFDATNAAPSRYDITAPSSSTDSSRDSMPPPGWGPRGSTTSWSLSGTGATVPVMPPGKAKKRSKGTSLLKELQGYAKLLVIVALAVVAVVAFMKARANSADFKVTIYAVPSEDIKGELVILDSAGNELAKKKVDDTGARCGTYKRSDVELRVKKSSDYVIEWNGARAVPVTDDDLERAGYALTLDIRRAVSVEVGAPVAVC